MLAPVQSSPSARSGPVPLLLHLARLLAEAAADDDGSGAEGSGADARGTGKPGRGTGDLDGRHPVHHLVATVGPLGDTSTSDRAARSGADGVDLLMRPLDGHPADILLGYVAPTEWSAVGTVVHASAHHLESPADPPPPLDEGERIVLAHLVARDGSSVAVCRRLDGSRWETSADTVDTAAAGLVDDTLRRVLGLPTRPPPTGPGELWARLWLDRVLSEVVAKPAGPWSWPSVAALHPAAQLVIDDLRGRVTEVVAAMPRLAEMLAESRTWTDVRLGYVAGRWHSAAIPPRIGNWMDDGIFSRWLLESSPSCGDTLVALRDLLPRRLITRIEQALAEWGVSTDIAVGGSPWLWPPEPRR